LSAIYFDILKDRLYTFPKDAPARRASQRVLHETLLTLTKLMAPVLSFAAEDIWRNIPERQRDTASVHLTQFPTADPRYKDPELEKRWDELIVVRNEAQSRLASISRSASSDAPSIFSRRFSSNLDCASFRTTINSSQRFSSSGSL